MNSSFLWYSLSAGALILQGFILITNVTHVNKLANRWLGLFFLCAATIFIQLLVEAAAPEESNPWFWLIPFLELPRWATFPCFFLSLRSFVNPTVSIRKATWHFVPFFLFCLYAAFVLFPDAYADNQIILNLPAWVVWVIRYLFLGQAIVYCTLSFLLLRRHERQIKRFSAIIEHVNLAWIRWIMYVVLGMTTLWILGKNDPSIAALVPFGYFALILFMAYHSLNQQAIYPISQSQLPEVIDAITLPDKRHARLTDDQVALLQKEVQKAVVDERLYLDPLLNLPALSEKVGLGTHELSFVLNQGFGKNFYQYINELRVEEAKRLLESEAFRDQDMASIAVHAGFNSRTTFYTAFKKIAGMTPKAYLEQFNT
ncbi:AraC family transcriptional regulator [Parapedobacter defluvii]|uniref:helix-turn-helix domain-containing protein n=1 Tax=Parapedobacter defluvii TaxID=2045106 RepID=UPI000FBCF9DD|nr:MAG: AraC family transcriptional regulator [Parapedobacter sp.]